MITAGVLTAALVYVSPVVSAPDAEGRVTLEVVLPEQPRSIPPGQDWRATYEWELPPGHWRLTRAWTFLASDRGDLIEAHCELFAASDRPFRLVQRSEHREAPTSYDGWREHVLRYAVPDAGSLALSVLGRATGVAVVRIHWGLRLELEPR